MKTFVFEYVCGGGWPEGHLPRSLATEGAAMLHALCDDLTHWPGVEVTATLDDRCRRNLPSDVRVISIESKLVGREQLLHQAALADVTLVIAPEIDNTLTRLVRELRASGCHVIAPQDNVLELCSDKLPLAGFLANQGIESISTFSLRQAEFPHLTTPLAVVKPRFGAGSQAISVVPTSDVEKLRQSPRTPPLEQLLVQPFVEGQALSIGSVANSAGGVAVFPVAQQRLSTDGYLQYRGGVVPWSGSAVERMQHVVRRCLASLLDPPGYIGFDFVVPDANPDEPLLVEINPRLCSSYLGYRRLTDDNLAARMLPEGPTHPIAWLNRRVRFEPGGSFTVTPLPEVSTCG